jgi:hypothetical protein
VPANTLLRIIAKVTASMRQNLVLQKHFFTAARLLFALWYFGVGVIGVITNDAVKDAANASKPLEKAMAESLFMNPLLCLACLAGGGAMLFRRTTPLGIVILAPLVIIIFCFHLIITKSYLWGSVNLILLAINSWQFRRGFDQLWNYSDGVDGAPTGEFRVLGSPRG